MSTAIGHRPRRVRAVLITGIIAGSALAGFGVINGLHFSWPGLPAVLGALTGLAAEWLLAVAVATIAVELLRRHHRALAARVWRSARARGGSLTGRLAGWAGPRWQRRWAPAAGAPAGAPAPPAPAAIAVPAAAPAAAVTSRNGETPMPATAPAPEAPPMPPTTQASEPARTVRSVAGRGRRRR